MNTYERALKTWGKEPQMLQVIEEMSELIKEILKNINRHKDNVDEIIEETADVEIMLEQLKKRFPNLEITVMVRGADIYNDATLEDAKYVGLDTLGTIITNGRRMAGTVYKMLPDKAKSVIDNSDIIFAKGQANYESFAGEGHHAFYTFLCKCDLFINRFNVPKLTGMFVEE